MTNEPNTTPGAPPTLPQQPQQPSGFEEMEGDTSLSNVLNKLLKKPLSLIHHLEMGESKSPLGTVLIVISIISLTIFGLVVGSFSAGTQLWAAPAKIVGGLLFSGLICLPSLYIFTCLGGLNARFRTVAGLLCAMIALTALLLVGFAPVVWLFSTSSNSIGFMGFLVTVLWLVCVGFGLSLIRRAGNVLGMNGSGHLLIWCAVFLLVTLQMPTTLRPIIGKSDKILNLEEKKFFLNYWGEVLNDSNRSAEQ